MEQPLGLLIIEGKATNRSFSVQLSNNHSLLGTTTQREQRDHAKLSGTDAGGVGLRRTNQTGGINEPAERIQVLVSSSYRGSESYHPINSFAKRLTQE